MERIGVILTTLWVTLIGYIIYLKADQAVSLSLNEWGDFLGGITAPIAFLWLIIGYALQRKELKMNTDALNGQRNELAKQNEYLSISANAAQEQVKQANTQSHQAQMEKLLGPFK